jgi:hypothetical protein
LRGGQDKEEVVSISPVSVRRPLREAVADKKASFSMVAILLCSECDFDLFDRWKTMRKSLTMGQGRIA